MNTGKADTHGRSAKSATDENGGSAESLTAAPEGKPGPARPAGPALAALGGGSGCGGLGPTQLRQPLPVCPAQGRSRLPPRLQARPQGPVPGGRGTYEGTPGVYPGPPPGPTGARWGCGARWPLCPHSSGLVSLPLVVPLCQIRRALAIAPGPRRSARHEGAARPPHPCARRGCRWLGGARRRPGPPPNCGGRGESRRIIPPAARVKTSGPRWGRGPPLPPGVGALACCGGCPAIGRGAGPRLGGVVISPGGRPGGPPGACPAGRYQTTRNLSRVVTSGRPGRP